MTYLGAGQIVLTSIHCIHRHIVCRDPDCCPARSSGLKINQNSLHAEIRVQLDLGMSFRILMLGHWLDLILWRI